MEMSPAVRCWDKEIFSLLSRGTDVSPHFLPYPKVFLFVCFLLMTSVIFHNGRSGLNIYSSTYIMFAVE